MSGKLLICFKGLSDPVRLDIINILSCGELCACEMLDGLSITQTTLSHHMKVLTNSGLIVKRKKGTYVYYKINKEKFSILQELVNELITMKSSCVCDQIKDNINTCK